MSDSQSEAERQLGTPLELDMMWTKEYRKQSHDVKTTRREGERFSCFALSACCCYCYCCCYCLPLSYHASKKIAPCQRWEGALPGLSTKNMPDKVPKLLWLFRVFSCCFYFWMYSFYKLREGVHPTQPNPTQPNPTQP